MYSKKTSRLSASLAVRLAFLFALVVGVCQVITFVVVYAVMASTVHARVDTRLRHEVGEVASLFPLHRVDVIQEALVRMAHAEGTDQALYRLIDARGLTLAESDTTAWQGLTVNSAALAAAGEGRQFFESVPGDPKEGKARVIYHALSKDMILQVALRTAYELQPIRDLRRLFVTVGVLGLCFSVVLGWSIAKHALTPLQTMTGTALAIAEGNLDARVQPGSRDAELDRLAGAFNMMLDRIQSFVRELREMNDSLAHDLRSVLARIHLAAERLLSTRPFTEEQESLTVSVVQESTELLGMLNTIMDLSEINTGVARTKFTPVDITEVVAELCEFFELTAKEKQVAMEFESTDNAVILGDRARLRRSFANVLDNAVKYTNPGGRISIRVRGDTEGVAVSIDDTGIGIPAAEQPFIFDRFYRADKSRSSDGHGLGLSLAAAIVHLHGGTIRAESQEGRGSTFTVIFPRSATAPF